MQKALLFTLGTLFWQGQSAKQVNAIFSKTGSLCPGGGWLVVQSRLVQVTQSPSE